MDLLADDAQLEVVDSTRRLLRQEMPMAKVRELIGRRSSLDPDFWKLCGSLGWFGVGLPEDQGGSGMSAVDEVLIVRELGRQLTPGPFIATILAARLAAQAGSELAGPILAGDIGVGLGEPHVDPSAVVGCALTGRFRALDAVGCAALLVLTPTAAALLIPQPAWTDAATVTCIDPASRLQIFELDQAAAAICVAGGELWTRALLLSAAMLVGIAEATLEASSSYAKVRHQYGKPIGAFQAVKHRCADMATRAEAARSLLFFAALSTDTGAVDAQFQAVAAKTIANDAAVRNTTDNIQNHGGMGFTQENDAHLYLKRARVFEHVYGSSAEREQVLLEGNPLW